jgi:hypothetical protein
VFSSEHTLPAVRVVVKMSYERANPVSFHLEFELKTLPSCACIRRVNGSRMSILPARPVTHPLSRLTGVTFAAVSCDFRRLLFSRLPRG